MNLEILDLLRCPSCGSKLSYADDGKTTVNPNLLCHTCSKKFPITNGIPRFVPADNYSNNFGFQWNKFDRTQLDTHTGLPLSQKRFFTYSGWEPGELKGKWVLDIGCGSGRFAEVALGQGAKVVAVDYSSAVDACWRNLGADPSLYVVQASIYELPFRPSAFDFVYCFGVLQHTPDVRGAFMALAPQLKPGGKLAVDVYPRLLRNILMSKYWVRPITKRLPQDRLFGLVKLMVKTLLPVSLVIGRIPAIGPKLRYAIPVANYEPDFPLSSAQVREWAILDTFDMLAPVHDHPQSASTLMSWFTAAGLQNIEVFRKGFYVGRGVKPL
jgi:SAM-dependent methyltransferase